MRRSLRNWVHPVLNSEKQKIWHSIMMVWYFREEKVQYRENS